MAYLHRIIILLFICLTTSAFANQPPINNYQYKYQNYPDLNTACGAVVSYNNSTDQGYQSIFKLESLSPPQTCFISYLNAAVNPAVRQTSNFGVNKTVVCPAGTDPTAYTNGDISECSGTPPAPPCIAGEGPTGYLAINSCLAGCTHVFSGQQAKIGDITYGMYLAKTGAQCTTSSGTPLMNKGDVDAAMKAADDKAAAAAAAAKAASDAKNAADKAAAAAAAADAKAKSDQAALDKASADAAAKKSADDAANASKSDAEKAASAAAAAAAKEKSDASNSASAAAAGSAAAAAKNDQPPEFCTEHPTSIICKNSSIVAGTCASGHSTGFSCSGDAIQCQIAQQQAETECKLYAPSDEAELGKRLLAGTDGSDSLNPSQTSNRTTIDLPNSLNEGSNIGGGEFSDYTVSLRGGGVTLPFSKINFVMHILGAFILAGAYLNAARIVGVRG